MSSEPANTRYLLRPADLEISGDVREALSALGPEPEAVAPEDVSRSLPPGGGWLIVPPGLGGGVTAEVLLALGKRTEPWGVLLLVREDGALRVLPLSPGYVEAPGRAAERLAEPGLDRGYLGHRALLEDLGRLRHDLNNALTSALAETQFLRMDAPPGTELAEGLEVVEKQLDRIRRLTESLVALRVPAS